MPPRVGDIPRIKSQNPISLRKVSRASAASGEKITLPEAPIGVPGFCRVAATNLAGRPVKVPLPRARNPKGHRFRCRVPEFWPDSLSPLLRRGYAFSSITDNSSAPHCTALRLLRAITSLLLTHTVHTYWSTAHAQLQHSCNIQSRTSATRPSSHGSQQTYDRKQMHASESIALLSGQTSLATGLYPVGSPRPVPRH